MALNGGEVVEIDETKATAIKPFVCLRIRDEIENYEEELNITHELDPCIEFDFLKLNSSEDAGNADVDLPVVAEKGQMALEGSEAIEIDDSTPCPEEECCILEIDPYKKWTFSKDVGNAEDELQVVAEKGQVACRDYPHPRHDCANYQFEKTSHDCYCELCYCYVCDLPAPCSKWTGSSGHCHAFDSEAWNAQRKNCRERGNKT